MTQEIKHTEERPREYLVLDPELIRRNAASDEISLLDLWAILSRKRILILGVLAASLVISVAIAFLITPVYKATIHFQSPLNKDISALNIPWFSFGYTVDSVYKEFQKNFKARNKLWDFFNEKQLYKAYLDGNGIEDADIARAFEGDFMKDMTLHQPKDEQVFINATLNWKDPTEGAALLNEYSQAIHNITVEQYVGELNDKLILEAEHVQGQIELLRESAQRTKNNRLTKLEENINIAKELGIKRWEGLVEEKISDVLVDVSGEQPLYYQGYEVLEAEKRTLQARKDDDPFTPGLNKRLDRLEYLNAIKIPADRIHAVRITQQAKPLHQPIKPRKKLIIMLGGVLGLFLGVLMAFISHAVSGQRVESFQGQGD